MSLWSTKLFDSLPSTGTIARIMAEEDPNLLNFEAARKARGDRDDHVRCPSCGKMIFASSRRCENCGVNFAGEAWEFEKGNFQIRKVVRRQSISWLLILFGLINIGIFVFALIYLRGE